MPRFDGNTTFEKPGLLIVEGPDDEAFFENLLKQMKLTEIDILHLRGKENYQALRAIAITPGFLSSVRSLGIVRDADTDPRGAFQSICSHLRNANLPEPPRARERTEGTPCVCVLILPSENEAGMLETLCLKAFETDAAMICTDQYFECLKQQAIPLRDEFLPKAKFQAFLASKDKLINSDDFGMRLRMAFQQDWWPWDEIVFAPVKEFLQNMADAI